MKKFVANHIRTIAVIAIVIAALFGLAGKMGAFESPVGTKLVALQGYGLRVDDGLQANVERQKALQFAEATNTASYEEVIEFNRLHEAALSAHAAYKQLCKDSREMGLPNVEAKKALKTEIERADHSAIGYAVEHFGSEKAALIFGEGGVWAFKEGRLSF